MSRNAYIGNRASKEEQIPKELYNYVVDGTVHTKQPLAYMCGTA